MISLAPFGPVDYCRTPKPYSPARLRAVWTPPHTSPTGFARSLNPPHQASHLQCPTTQPGYWNVWRTSHSKWRHKPATAHTPHTHTHTPLAQRIGNCTLADLVCIVQETKRTAAYSAVISSLIVTVCFRIFRCCYLYSLLPLYKYLFTLVRGIFLLFVLEHAVHTYFAMNL